ncbi:predicted protein [Uncinocarpus reesii 1704]|uniref:Uncharacterized protein n=1 Tax=Uncinocarpus reesii (strain UAMH 1704) TaxID=336963 RepID=C4JR10_UNCRE|nr:uncharacterized protein UREG_03492 [Uncinocarpus reesii 1704]EEP78646.1 predicted protein [Uncinocarpus reesii 1704]
MPVDVPSSNDCQWLRDTFNPPSRSDPLGSVCSFPPDDVNGMGRASNLIEHTKLWLGLGVEGGQIGIVQRLITAAERQPSPTTAETGPRSSARYPDKRDTFLTRTIPIRRLEHPGSIGLFLFGNIPGSRSIPGSNSTGYKPAS